MTQDALGRLLALAEKADRFTLITEYGRCTHMDKGEVIAALVRVAMAADAYTDACEPSTHNDCVSALEALDAALAMERPPAHLSPEGAIHVGYVNKCALCAPAMEKPAEEPPKVGIDGAVRKFCNMTPEQMRAWIIKHDDPPSCPHGVMAGACPACMGMAGKYRQEPTAGWGSAMNREQAVALARKHAKAKPQSYYAEPFEPHEWVIDAIHAAWKEGLESMMANVGRSRSGKRGKQP